MAVGLTVAVVLMAIPTTYAAIYLAVTSFRDYREIAALKREAAKLSSSPSNLTPEELPVALEVLEGIQSLPFMRIMYVPELMQVWQARREIRRRAHQDGTDAADDTVAQAPSAPNRVVVYEGLNAQGKTALTTSPHEELLRHYIWVKGFEEYDEYMRIDALMRLGDIGERGEGFVPALIKALDSESKLVRARAAEALSEIGEPPDEIVSALTRALDNEVGFVRNVVAEALERIDTPGAREALREYRASE